MLIAFLRFSIHRDSMGQQLRVQIKRKRRRAYLQRKKASQRAATNAAGTGQATGTKRIRSGGVILIRSLRHSERSAVTYLINTSLQRGGLCVDNGYGRIARCITSLKRGVNDIRHSNASIPST